MIRVRHSNGATRTGRPTGWKVLALCASTVFLLGMGGPDTCSKIQIDVLSSPARVREWRRRASGHQPSFRYAHESHRDHCERRRRERRLRARRPVVPHSSRESSPTSTLATTWSSCGPLASVKLGRSAELVLNQSPGHRPHVLRAPPGALLLRRRRRPGQRGARACAGTRTARSTRVVSFKYRTTGGSWGGLRPQRPRRRPIWHRPRRWTARRSTSSVRWGARNSQSLHLFDRRALAQRAGSGDTRTFGLERPPDLLLPGRGCDRPLPGRPQPLAHALRARSRKGLRGRLLDRYQDGHPLTTSRSAARRRSWSRIASYPLTVRPSTQSASVDLAAESSSTYTVRTTRLCSTRGIPQYSYPDMITQTIHIGDCELIERWMDVEVLFGNPKWADWENRIEIEGLNAINGFGNPYLPLLPFLPQGSSECVNAWRGLSPLVLNPHFGTVPGISLPDQINTEWTHFGDADQHLWCRSGWLCGQHLGQRRRPVRTRRPSFGLHRRGRVPQTSTRRPGRGRTSRTWCRRDVPSCRSSAPIRLDLIGLPPIPGHLSKHSRRPGAGATWRSRRTAASRQPPARRLIPASDGGRLRSRSGQSW